jgi:NADPH2:quinone reductase
MIINEFGDSEKFQLAEMSRPMPADDEVLIRVACAAVNPVDWKERQGVFGQGPRRREYSFPCVLGFDASGVVEAVGRDVAGVRPGDRVVTCSDGPGNGGTYAEFVAVRQDRVGPMPRSIDFANAAAYPLAGLTVWQDLFGPEKGALQAGQSVLIHGGAGGLGSYGIQFAKAAGLHVAATCSTRNLDYVASLGADCVIDYVTQDIVSAARAWAPGGVDVVIDAVGPATLPAALDMIRPGGRLVSVATLTDDGDIAAGQAVAAARGMEKIWAIMSFENVTPQLAEIATLFDQGAVRPPPITIYPLERLAEAHREVETGHVRGKVVIHVADLDEPTAASGATASAGA